MKLGIFRWLGRRAYNVCNDVQTGWKVQQKLTTQAEREVANEKHKEAYPPTVDPAPSTEF